MAKKRIIAAVAVLAFVDLILGVLATLPPRNGVTKANLDRIEIGMKNTDVETLLGKTGDVEWPGRILWEGDEGWGMVNFDEDGRVTRKVWLEFPDERTLLERLLDRLPWRERRRPLPPNRTL